MTSKQKEYLLNLARSSIDHYLIYNSKYDPVLPEDLELTKERAVFVTLNRNSDLRGCIGHMKARMPLFKAVAEMANAAAFEDYRFSPVKKSELDNIKIEISILSPMHKIQNYRKIRLGIDGVLINKGFHSGVFLPQVATETGWDLITFLSNLCLHKAGLPSEAFLDPETDIYIFQIEKITD